MTLFDKKFDIDALGPEVYYSYTKSKVACEEIADQLLSDPDLKNNKKSELVEFLEHSDKGIFKGFRDKEISMAQLKARVYKRRFKMDYTCFDDIKADLDPDWIDPKKTAAFRPKMKMIFGDTLDPADL
jgi:hypothetical protein